MSRQDATDQTDWVRGELLMVSLLSRLRGAKRNQASWVCVYFCILTLLSKIMKKRTTILFQMHFCAFEIVCCDKQRRHNSGVTRSLR